MPIVTLFLIVFAISTTINVEFELYLIKEFQCLNEEQKQIEWSAKRELSKINYRIHTDAIKANLIPAEVTREQAALKYADEADVLNIVMFGDRKTIAILQMKILEDTGGRNLLQ